jgi:hypothetical protein
MMAPPAPTRLQVGDRLDTDIMFGKNGGLTTCLVLSGGRRGGAASVRQSCPDSGPAGGCISLPPAAALHGTLVMACTGAWAGAVCRPP